MQDVSFISTLKNKKYFELLLIKVSLPQQTFAAILSNRIQTKNSAILRYDHANKNKNLY